jgi:hypothetical protein
VLVETERLAHHRFLAPPQATGRAAMPQAMSARWRALARVSRDTIVR